jgi:ABC-type Fe3+/spermidine/putrescine transport system ATPase subunit
MSTLSLIGVEKSFGGQPVLTGINLEVQEGEFVSLLGPSGCGKTTTLNIVAGFQAPDAGEVRITQQRVNEVPVHQRNLGMVFQGHALFPHMTCFENVAFGLRMRRMSEQELRQRVMESLELVHLSALAGRYPRELSGGQQQRVGLARALAIRPSILLLDEPLSNLDAKLRRAMQGELRQIHTQVRTTMIYVTHDQEEALTLSDRVAVMNLGRIEQLDTPEGIYARPKTRFVADFIGSTGFLEGVVVDTGGDHLIVDVPEAGMVRVTRAEGDWRRGQAVHLGVRSDRVRIVLADTDADTIQGTVLDRAFAGAVHHVVVDIGQGRRITSHMSEAPSPEIRPGARIGVHVSPKDWMLLE